MPATIAERNGMLNAYLPTTGHATYAGNATLFLSIHTADPGDTGANEYTGYSGGLRTSITFASPASGSVVSNNQQDYTSMGAITITHIGFWTANTAGTFKGGGALTASKTTASGDTLRFVSGNVTVTIN